MLNTAPEAAPLPPPLPDEPDIDVLVVVPLRLPARALNAEKLRGELSTALTAKTMPWPQCDALVPAP